MAERGLSSLLNGWLHVSNLSGSSNMVRHEVDRHTRGFNCARPLSNPAQCPLLEADHGSVGSSIIDCATVRCLLSQELHRPAVPPATPPAHAFKRSASDVTLLSGGVVHARTAAARRGPTTSGMPAASLDDASGNGRGVFGRPKAAPTVAPPQPDLPSYLQLHDDRAQAHRGGMISHGRRRTAVTNFAQEQVDKELGISPEQQVRTSSPPTKESTLQIRENAHTNTDIHLDSLEDREWRRREGMKLHNQEDGQRPKYGRRGFRRSLFPSDIDFIRA
jgi:hypothetical protein